MSKSRLKIKIVTSNSTNEKIQRILYQSIAKQIFESADFMKLLDDNLKEAL